MRRRFRASRSPARRSVDVAGRPQDLTKAEALIGQAIELGAKVTKLSDGLFEQTSSRSVEDLVAEITRFCTIVAMRQQSGEAVNLPLRRRQELRRALQGMKDIISRRKSTSRRHV